MIGAEKQGLRPTKQSNDKVLIWEFLGGTRSSEIDIEEKFRCIVGRDGDDGVGIREKIYGFFFFFSFFPDFSYFLLITNFSLKKMQNGVVSVGLMAAINWVVTEPYIDKNWKLEDWIDKTES